MACAAKSNAVYTAYQAAAKDAASLGSLEVPLHLRNAPTRLMKDIGYGKGYRYAHDEPEGHAAGERYFPDAMPDRRYYVPVARGLEIKIGEALDARRSRDRKARDAAGSSRSGAPSPPSPSPPDASSSGASSTPGASSAPGASTPPGRSSS